MARPGDQAAGLTGATRARVGLALGVAVVVAVVVVVLRLANAGDEPEGQNWWLVAGLVLGLAYLPAGAILTARRDRRLLGGLFLVVGASGPARRALHAVPRLRARPRSGGALVVAGGSLDVDVAGRRRCAGHPRPARPAASRLAAWTGACVPRWASPAVGIVVTAVDPDGWAGPAVVALVAVTAVVLLAVRWRLRRRGGDDPLPAWLLAGGVVAVLGVVPSTFEDLVERAAGTGCRRPAAAHRHRPPPRGRRAHRDRAAGTERPGAGVAPVPGVGAAGRRHRRHLHRARRRAGPHGRRQRPDVAAGGRHRGDRAPGRAGPPAHPRAGRPPGLRLPRRHPRRSSAR